MKTYMGRSEFNRQLAIMHGAAKLTAQHVQTLLEDGIIYAAHPSKGGDGNLDRLSKVLNAVQQSKGLPTQTIKRYIQVWVDASWKKGDDGVYRFKFNNGAGSTFPDVTWMDWTGNTEKKAKPDIDLVKSLENMLKNAKTAKKNGKKVEHEELIPYIEAALLRSKAEVHEA